jgi:hypothetical protein
LNLGEIYSGVAYTSVFLLLKQTTFVLVPFFFHAKFLIHTKQLHQESNPGQFVGGATFVSVISCLKQAALLLVLSFYLSF